MDLATIIGVFSGFALLLAAIFMKPGAMFFFKIDAFIIVFGGTMAATLAQFPLKTFLNAINVSMKALFHKQVSIPELIDKLVELARKARVEGLLSLEKDIQEIDDAFIQKGLQLMVDGTEAEELEDVLSTELNCIVERHDEGQKIFKAMTEYSPAFGMAGTLIGLIQMLQQLQDPSKIGAGMAVALVTTFYGVVFANLIYSPIAGKLALRSDNEILMKEMVIKGVTAIQAGDNPRMLRDKLMTYLAPKHRTEADEE